MRMDTIENIKKILAEGFSMIENVNRPTVEKHRTMEYILMASDKLREAGIIVHSLTPELADMIQFVHEYVPQQYHGNVNHAWSGIGEWVA